MATDPVFGEVVEDPVFGASANPAPAQPLPETIATPAPTFTAPALTDPVFGAQQQIDADLNYSALRATGDRPEDDVPAPGFLTALHSGTANLIGSLREPALMFGEKLTQWMETTAPDLPVTQYFREQTELERGYLQEARATAANAPLSETFVELAEAENWSEFSGAFLESDEKWTAVKELIGLSAPFSLGMMGATAIGGLPGTAVSVFTMDWGDSYRESINEGKTHEDALDSATIKALTQSGFDTATMGIAGIKLFSNSMMDWTGQMVVQMVGGGGAEIAKNEFVDEDYTFGEVALEAAGELVTGVPEIAFRRATMGRKEKDKSFGDLKKEFEELMRNKDYENAQKHLPRLIETIQERLRVAADEDVFTVEDLQKQGLTGPLSEDPTDIRFGNVNPADSAAWWDLTNVVNQETGEIEPASTHDFDAAPVAVTQETFLNNKIKELETVIAAQEADILEADLAGNIEAVLEGQLIQEDNNQKLDQLQTHRGIEFNYSNKAASMLTEWAQAIVPDMEIIFSTSHAGEVMAGLRNNPLFNVKNPGNAGHHWVLDDGTKVIELDLNSFTNSDGSIREQNWVEALTHEFGHAVMSHALEKADPITRKALTNSYLKWLRDMLQSKTVGEYQNHRYSPAYAAAFIGQGTASPFNPKQDTPQDRKQYNWGMDEWTANQMSKALQTTEAVQGPVRKFFEDLITKMKEFFKLVEGKYAATDTFQDFVNLLAAKVALGDLASVHGADVLTQQEAGRKALAVVNSIATELGLKIPKGKVPPDVNFPHEASNMDGAIDKYGFGSKWALTLLQLADRNPHIIGLRKYVQNVRRWWTDKMKFIGRADERLQAWRKLGDKRAAAVGAFMQDLTVLSYDEGKKYGPQDEEFGRLVRKHGLDEEQLAMVAEIEGDFTAVLDELYAVLLADTRKTNDPIDQGRQLDKLNKDFEALRNRNFFPLSRFGEYYMRVKAKTDMVFEGKEYKEGDVITFEMFEGGALFTNFSMDTPPALKKREKPFRNNDLFEVSSGVVNDTQREFAGLPPQFLELMRDRLDLNESQKKELDNLLRDIAPGRSFTKHMKTRKNVGGYSSDSLRAYADYFQHFANYVARIKYKGELQNNINEVTDSANVIAQKTGNSVKRGRIAQFMQDHFEYVMNPDNEWANLRSFGFLWYLGFVPKSAVINLTQVGLVTQPFLGARFGDIAAARALTGAMRDAGRAMRSEKRGLREDQNRLIDYLIDTGIIEESMATELAAIAEGRTFARTATNTLFGSQKLGSALRNGAGYGAWLFQTAEKYNRRVTALAAYELALKKGIPVRNQNGKLTGEFRPATEKEMFLFAQQTVEGTQFEYARFNRPRFMQGKKSVLFLFWQYMQNMLYFTGNDPGAARYLMVMLVAAGLSGLPFSEDLMDIIDFLAKKLNKHFGTDEFLPVNVRGELRSMIAELGANPDLVMHGASRYTMGLPYLADAVGLPMPLVDVSGSLSMGRIIPGIESLTRSDAPMRGDLGRAAEAAGGAVANIPLSLIYAIADDNPDTWRRWEKATPTIVQHISKAIRYTTRGEATTPEGAMIKDFIVPEDKMDLAQVLFQAGGFADTEINREQEEHYMKKDMLTYYELRKRMYLEELSYYHRNGDTKEFQVVMSDIRRYNKSLRKIGLGQMVVGPATIRRSLTERIKKRKFIELGMPKGKKGIQVGREIEEGFTEELRQ